MKSTLSTVIIGLSLAMGALSFAPVVYAANNANGSETTGQYISSSALTAQVKSALIGTKGIDSNDITVTTVNDVVTLQGVVDNKAQVELAGRVAAGVNGVVGVNNKLVSKK